MAAINPNALSKFVGILEIAPEATPTTFTRLGSVRNLTLNYDTTVDTVEVNADDTGTVFKGYTPEARVEGEFLEVFIRDTIELIFGGVASDVAGVLVPGATQVLTSGSWNVNIFNKIENQNGDGSIITINSVTGSVDGALTANDDYDLIQDANGDYGIVLQDIAQATNLTTIAQNITINYDYTPNASENLVLTQSFTEAKNLVVKITATDPDNPSDERIITLNTGTFEGTYALPFLDAVENGDIPGTTFSFIGNKNSTLTIENEIL